MKILLNIILTIIWLGAKLFALAVLLYFVMLFYLGYKDGTIYEYKEFACKNKSFITTTPVSIYSSQYSKVITLEMQSDDKAKKNYPVGSKFYFVSLYSLYDFEGGTFYKYLIEDDNSIKSFIRFSDINPKECTLDVLNKYWFKNNKSYRPTGNKNKNKISKSDRDSVFDTNKGKL